MSTPSLVLGTAGHIDHGKSSLVRALTGTDPDRLKEEKQRGITIELGFALLELPSGRSMGVVDVPGHEKFVRQMVAGATGIDVVMLVIAADDGVMPQTREHLAILDLLGVDNGVVALTKADLADPEWIELVKADITQLLVGTGIEGAPIVPVSSKTRMGIDELLAALDAVATDAPSKHANLPMRLPVDRVFTIQGAGTVVTGTMWSGSASKDDPVQIYPENVEGRVRGVQVHGVGVDRAHAGQRVAMNVAGVERDEISRGDIIAAPGTLTVTDRFDGRFTYLGTPGDDRPFETGARVHVHTERVRCLAAFCSWTASPRARRGRVRWRRSGWSSPSPPASMTDSSCAATRRSTRSGAGWCSTRCHRAAPRSRLTSPSCSTRY
jgi:selenocysteine-specific elongation factor